MISSLPLKNHDLRRFPRMLFPILVLAVIAGPACRPKSGSHPVSFRFIDELTNAGIVESPLKNPETAGLGEQAYPDNSFVLAESESGEAAFGLKRRLNLGVMSTEFLFAPPRSEFRFQIPFKTEGILDFGIGIVRDAPSVARVSGGEDPSGSVKFMVILETGGRKKVLFEHVLKQPEARKSRAINQVWQRIPLPARKAETTLTLITSGASGAFAFWSHPVLYVPEKNPLNVILISIDTLRADHVGAYGYDRPLTPAIDTLAADGVVFENAYSTAPWTLPAHVSMLTGLNCVRHRVYAEYDRMDPRIPTLAEIMRKRGYATWAITSGGFVSAKFGFSKGFDEYHMDQFDMMDMSQAAKTGYDAEQWIEKNADRSFFLFLHTYQVHSPYKSPLPYRTMFLRPDAPWTRADIVAKLGGRGYIYKPLSEAERANVIALYDAGVRFTDETLVKLVVDTLRRLQLYDRTMIIVTSDHGEEFYDHGGWDHWHSAYDEIIHIPLIIKMPRSEFRGRRYPSIVRLLDLMPTILDYGGIPSKELSLNGESLRPILQGKETGDRVFLAELAENVLNSHIPRRVASNNGRLKVIVYQPFSQEDLEFFSIKPPPFPPIELYDLARDPAEKTNVINRPEEAAKARDLVQKAREIDRLIPRRERKESQIDKDLEDQLRALGYIR